MTCRRCQLTVSSHGGEKEKDGSLMFLLIRTLILSDQTPLLWMLPFNLNEFITLNTVTG